MISGQSVLTALAKEWFASVRAEEARAGEEPEDFYCRACDRFLPNHEIHISSHEGKHACDLSWDPLLFWRQTAHLHAYVALPVVREGSYARLDVLRGLSRTEDLTTHDFSPGIDPALRFVRDWRPFLPLAGVRLKTYAARGGVDAYFLMGRDEWFFLLEMMNAGLPLADVEQVYRQMAANLADPSGAVPPMRRKARKARKAQVSL